MIKYVIKFPDISRSAIKSEIFLGNSFCNTTDTYSYLAKVNIKKSHQDVIFHY